MPRLAALLLAVLLAGPAAAADWQRYVNDRFGTAVDVPTDVFRPQPPPENGDGRRFETADGLASLTVFAGYNTGGLNLRELVDAARDDAADERVTYEREGRRWFVISGFRGENVFYRKLILSPDGEVAHTLELVYPADEKPFFDPLTTRIANSMSGG
jgi:hypothetical protein